MANSDNTFLIESLVAPCYSEPNFMSSKLTEAVSGETVKIIKKKKIGFSLNKVTAIKVG